MTLLGLSEEPARCLEGSGDAEGCFTVPTESPLATEGTVGPGFGFTPLLVLDEPLTKPSCRDGAGGKLNALACRGVSEGGDRRALTLSEDGRLIPGTRALFVGEPERVAFDFDKVSPEERLRWQQYFDERLKKQGKRRAGRWVGQVLARAGASAGPFLVPLGAAATLWAAAPDSTLAFDSEDRYGGIKVHLRQYDGLQRIKIQARRKGSVLNGALGLTLENEWLDLDPARSDGTTLTYARSDGLSVLKFHSDENRWELLREYPEPPWFEPTGLALTPEGRLTMSPPVHTTKEALKDWIPQRFEMGATPQILFRNTDSGEMTSDLRVGGLTLTASSAGHDRAGDPLIRWHISDFNTGDLDLPPMPATPQVIQTERWEYYADGSWEHIVTDENGVEHVRNAFYTNGFDRGRVRVVSSGGRRPVIRSREGKIKFGDQEYRAEFDGKKLTLFLPNGERAPADVLQDPALMHLMVQLQAASGDNSFGAVDLILGGQPLASLKDGNWSLTAVEVMQEPDSLANHWLLARLLGIVCFVEGTWVHTGSGLQPIETLEVGDLVWAQDEETGEQALRPVVATKQTAHQRALRITLKGPEGVEALGVTKDHRIYTPAKQWVTAGSLKPQDIIATQSGELLRVTGVEPWGDPVTVYNVEVEGFHTYFVGAHKTWVHNNYGEEDAGDDDGGSGLPAKGPLLLAPALVPPMPSLWGPTQPTHVFQHNGVTAPVVARMGALVLYADAVKSAESSKRVLDGFVAWAKENATWLGEHGIGVLFADRSEGEVSLDLTPLQAPGARGPTAEQFRDDVVGALLPPHETLVMRPVGAHWPSVHWRGKDSIPTHGIEVSGKMFPALVHSADGSHELVIFPPYGETLEPHSGLSLALGREVDRLLPHVREQGITSAFVLGEPTRIIDLTTAPGSPWDAYNELDDEKLEALNRAIFGTSTPGGSVEGENWRVVRADPSNEPAVHVGDPFFRELKPYGHFEFATDSGVTLRPTIFESDGLLSFRFDLPEKAARSADNFKALNDAIHAWLAVEKGALTSRGITSVVIGYGNSADPYALIDLTAADPRGSSRRSEALQGELPSQGPFEANLPRIGSGPLKWNGKTYVPSHVWVDKSGRRYPVVIARDNYGKTMIISGPNGEKLNAGVLRRLGEDLKSHDGTLTDAEIDAVFVLAEPGRVGAFMLFSDPHPLRDILNLPTAQAQVAALNRRLFGAGDADVFGAPAAASSPLEVTPVMADKVRWASEAGAEGPDGFFSVETKAPGDPSHPHRHQLGYPWFLQADASMYLFMRQEDQTPAMFPVFLPPDPDAGDESATPSVLHPTVIIPDDLPFDDASMYGALEDWIRTTPNKYAVLLSEDGTKISSVSLRDGDETIEPLQTLPEYAESILAPPANSSFSVEATNDWAPIHWQGLDRHPLWGWTFRKGETTYPVITTNDSEGGANLVIEVDSEAAMRALHADLTRPNTKSWLRERGVTAAFGMMDTGEPGLFVVLAEDPAHPLVGWSAMPDATIKQLIRNHAAGIDNSNLLEGDAGGLAADIVDQLEATAAALKKSGEKGRGEDDPATLPSAALPAIGPLQTWPAGEGVYRVNLDFPFKGEHPTTHFFEPEGAPGARYPVLAKDGVLMLFPEGYDREGAGGVPTDVVDAFDGWISDNVALLGRHGIGVAYYHDEARGFSHTDFTEFQTGAHRGAGHTDVSDRIERAFVFPPTTNIAQAPADAVAIVRWRGRNLPATHVFAFRAEDGSEHGFPVRLHLSPTLAGQRKYAFEALLFPLPGEPIPPEAVEGFHATLDAMNASAFGPKDSAGRRSPEIHAQIVLNHAGNVTSRKFEAAHPWETANRQGISFLNGLLRKNYPATERPNARAETDDPGFDRFLLEPTDAAPAPPASTLAKPAGKKPNGAAAAEAALRDAGGLVVGGLGPAPEGGLGEAIWRNGERHLREFQLAVNGTTYSVLSHEREEGKTELAIYGANDRMDANTAGWLLRWVSEHRNALRTAGVETVFLMGGPTAAINWYPVARRGPFTPDALASILPPDQLAHVNQTLFGDQSAGAGREDEAAGNEGDHVAKLRAERAVQASKDLPVEPIKALTRVASLPDGDALRLVQHAQGRLAEAELARVKSTARLLPELERAREGLDADDFPEVSADLDAAIARLKRHEEQVIALDAGENRLERVAGELEVIQGELAALRARLRDLEEQSEAADGWDSANTAGEAQQQVARELRDLLTLLHDFVEEHALRPSDEVVMDGGRARPGPSAPVAPGAETRPWPQEPDVEPVDRSDQLDADAIFAMINNFVAGPLSNEVELLRREISSLEQQANLGAALSFHRFLASVASDEETDGIDGLVWSRFRQGSGGPMPAMDRNHPGKRNADELRWDLTIQVMQMLHDSDPQLAAAIVARAKAEMGSRQVRDGHEFMKLFLKPITTYSRDGRGMERLPNTTVNTLTKTRPEWAGYPEGFEGAASDVTWLMNGLLAVEGGRRKLSVRVRSNDKTVFVEPRLWRTNLPVTDQLGSQGRLFTHVVSQTPDGTLKVLEPGHELIAQTLLIGAVAAWHDVPAREIVADFVHPELNARAAERYRDGIPLTDVGTLPGIFGSRLGELDVERARTLAGHANEALARVSSDAFADPSHANRFSVIAGYHEIVFDEASERIVIRQKNRNGSGDPDDWEEGPARLHKPTRRK